MTREKKKLPKRSKEEQQAMSKYLTEKFAEISKGQELIPVVLQRSDWEAIAYSIQRALKLEYKKKGNSDD